MSPDVSKSPLILMSHAAPNGSLLIVSGASQTLLRTWHCALDTNQVVLNRDISDLQVLDSDLFGAHVSGHALAFEYFLRVHAAD